MLKIGCHLSTAKGLDKAVGDAARINATAMQLFTRNPRGGKSRVIKEKETAAVVHSGLNVVLHAPYTINLASSKEDVREFGVRTIIEDVSRMDFFVATQMVVHSGAHTGSGDAAGLGRLIESLEIILPHIPHDKRLLLEGMSGQGSELGKTVEELATVLAHFNWDARLGVCLDTCHLFAAGYDVRDWASFKEGFTQHIPWGKVGCIHLNDSKIELGSHKDRHECWGCGHLGWTTAENVVRAEIESGIPLILETPNELAGYAAEIEHLREIGD